MKKSLTKSFTVGTLGTLEKKMEEVVDLKKKLAETIDERNCKGKRRAELDCGQIDQTVRKEKERRRREMPSLERKP